MCRQSRATNQSRFLARNAMATFDAAPTTSAAPRDSKQQPFYKVLWVQVLFAMSTAVVLGYFWPDTGIAMKPFGDAFIRLITMIITLIIFCTVVSGIAGMQDMKKVGRVGGKALLYFEIVS